MNKSENISASLAARIALEKYGFHASRALGQNFILDEELIDRIVKAASVNSGDRVLEIGPGAGVMTRRLSEVGANVNWIEDWSLSCARFSEIQMFHWYSAIS